MLQWAKQFHGASTCRSKIKFPLKVCCATKCMESMVDCNSTEIPTTWGVNLLIAGTQVSLPTSQLDFLTSSSQCEVKGFHQFLRKVNKNVVNRCSSDQKLIHAFFFIWKFFIAFHSAIVTNSFHDSKCCRWKNHA